MAMLSRFVALSVSLIQKASLLQIYASDRDWTMRGTVMSDNLIYSVGNASTV